jgi:hypothetical protein
MNGHDLDTPLIGFDGSTDDVSVVLLARTPDGWRITGGAGPAPVDLVDALTGRHNRPARRWNDNPEPGTVQPGLAEQVRAWMAEHTPEIDVGAWQRHILDLVHQHTGPVLTGPVYTPRRNTLGQHIAHAYGTPEQASGSGPDRPLPP